jgi:acyl transferase domain-containing protein/acyl carrier protein/NADP-dependent 3-hydroxy acid dehydrogenase YdfG
VIWLTPKWAKGVPKEMYTSLSPWEDEIRYEVYSLDNTVKTLHSQGSVTTQKITPKVKKYDIAALKERMPNEITGEQWYRKMANLDLVLGKCYTGVDMFYHNDDEVMTRINFSKEEGYVLSVGIMDSALQTCVGWLLEKENYIALPFGVKEVNIYKEIPGGTLWGYAKKSENNKENSQIINYDIDLLDTEGEVVIGFKEFVIRSFNGEETNQQKKKIDTKVISKDVKNKSLELKYVQYIKEILSKELKVLENELELHAPFESYGIDSVLINRLTNRLEESFGRLSRTLFFEYQTLGELIDYFIQEHSERLNELIIKEELIISSNDAIKADHKIIPDVKGERFTTLENVRESDDNKTTSTDIAIIGLSGRYPEAKNINEFWENLKQGKDCITEIPDDRWEKNEFYHQEKGVSGKSYSKWGGFMKDIDKFDPLFFNIAPNEAQLMDPQERLFLQIVWETIEDAGYTRAQLLEDYNSDKKNRNKIGVYAGAMFQDYSLLGVEQAKNGGFVPDGIAANIANRVSYFFNFQGPSITLDTMCSSSLTAIHMACQGLLTGDAQMAIAGGVNISSHPNKYFMLCQKQFLSSRGKCESFGIQGNGYVPGEGVGAVLLKPLDKAKADGDHIYGIIKGTSINHGGKTNGYTVPNPIAQSSAIKETIKKAGVKAEDFSYIEAHGTGTSLGDPIEMTGLTRAFQSDKKQFCSIGSVKSNIGHCESAAGISGITKVLLQLKYKQLVPSLHSSELNPYIDFEVTPFKVQQELEEWTTINNKPRLAGVSSFGAGGSNAHIIIEEYDNTDQISNSEIKTLLSSVVIVLSAKNKARLQECVQNLKDYVDKTKGLNLYDIAYTLQTGREAMNERLAFVTKDISTLIAELENYLEGKTKNITTGIVKKDKANSKLGSQNKDEESLVAIRNKDNELLTQIWVKGEIIDWEALYSGHSPKRISLPTYPFEQKRYWLPEIPKLVEISNPYKNGHSTLELRNIETNQSVNGVHKEVEEKVCFTPHWKPKELTKTSSKSKTSGDSVTIFVASSRTDIIEKIEALDIADHVFELHPAQDIANQVLNNTLQLFEYCKYLIKNKKSRQEKLIVYVPYKDTAFPYRSLMGLLRSVALESPFLKTQLVFDSALEKGAINEITKHLNDEIHFSNNASEVLYTQDQSRFLFTQKKLSNTADVPHTSKIKINGVYLITGGLGSLGHVFTEFIGEYKGVKIVLTGRSSITPEKKIALEKLSLKGIEVHYVSCDLSREATTKQMIDDVINRFGTIDGVIHSAGVIRDNYCVKKTASEILDVLSPKVTSVIHLDEVTKDIALDFFVLFSSIASLGSAGQIDYATGNAFMDIFAQHRADLVKKGIRKGKSISLNWPLWKDGGMTPGVFYEEAMFKNWGMRPLKTKTGIQAFINALESEEHQYGIITGNAQKILKTLKINAIEENDEVYKAVKRPLITLESIQNNVLEEISKIIGIDKIDIDPSEELIDYGLESVTLMQLVELLNTIYNLDYSGASFFELTTVRLITAQIYESINKERPQLEIFQEVISPDSAKKKAHHDTIFESENELENKIQDSVLEGISKVIGIEKSAINLTDALIDYGLDSLTLMQLADILNTIYDSNYTGSTFFELDTVALITSHLYENIKHNQPQVKIFENKQPILVVDQKEIVIIDKLQIKNQDAERREIKGQHKLAIIGYDCKFPNSDNPDAFWKNIIDKVVTIKNIKPEQWKKRGIAGGSIHKSMKWGSLLHDVDRFDAPFWGVSRLKAEEMDPQLRLLLQSVWRGIEHSGYAISTFSEQKIGVFVAADATDYEVVLKENNKIPSIENSISVGMLSNRISYYFNFNGPSESIDNACSSVYVALSQAQRALQTGACDVAIVAGVKLLLDPLGFMMREELLSTSGNMYSFDKKSDGYIRGEGVGCLILKPATEAQKDLNTIHAIVAGTSIVHNGNKGFSSMAPNVEAQYEAMKAAYYMAGIDPETVHYIEAHGTATNFNDAAEIAAYKKFLKAEMSENAYKNHRCAISTVKPNIGHLEGASGIASILKAVLALKHHKIPPVALFSEPHPSLFLEDSPFYIPTELSDWEIKKGEIIDEEYPRRVALHAVGIGGVNAHVILEEHHAKPKKAAENINKKYRPKLFVISTKSQMALKKYGEKWLRYLNDIENSDENTAQLLANIAYSSQFTREAMPYRQAFVAGSLEEMKTCLQKGILGIEKWKSNTSYLVTNGDHPVGKVSDMATELTKDRSFKYLRMLAEQWISGISIDWKTFSKNEYVERTSIPEYPFEEEKYWYGVSENEENIEDPFETLFHETFINE